ncbi:MAG: DNA-binding protein HU [Candidatus Puniceispirillum sp.]|nr:DNA-binding protein HU [Candidatus Puniceispirillum sp.]MCA0370414.1 HU family DNA-binding protein [Pseudomonadota bacterium]
MNRNEFVARVSESAGLTKTDASKAIDSVFEVISASLSQGHEVRLVGFGTFAIAERKASEGRNPRTGEKINIPAARLPKFRAGKGLKDAVAKAA